VKINGVAFAISPDGDVTISWNHRNRLGPYIVAQDAGDVAGGPEGSYTVTIHINGSLIRTVTGITGNSYFYSAAQRLADDANLTHAVTLTIMPVHGGISGTSRSLTFVMSGVSTGGPPEAPPGWTPPAPDPPGTTGTKRPTAIGPGGADPGTIGGQTAGNAHTLGNVIDSDTDSYTEFYCPGTGQTAAVSFVASEPPNGPTTAASITANIDLEIVENDANGANYAGLVMGDVPAIFCSVGFTFLRWPLLSVAIGGGPVARQVYSVSIPVDQSLGLLRMQFFYGQQVMSDSTSGGVKVRVHDVNFVIT
jgi:hypothetical protein